MNPSVKWVQDANRLQGSLVGLTVTLMTTVRPLRVVLSRLLMPRPYQGASEVRSARSPRAKEWGSREGPSLSTQTAAPTAELPELRLQTVRAGRALGCPDPVTPQPRGDPERARVASPERAGL